MNQRLWIVCLCNVLHFNTVGTLILGAKRMWLFKIWYLNLMQVVQKVQLDNLVFFVLYEFIILHTQFSWNLHKTRWWHFSPLLAVVFCFWEMYNSVTEQRTWYIEYMDLKPLEVFCISYEKVQRCSFKKDELVLQDDFPHILKSLFGIQQCINSSAALVCSWIRSKKQN